MVLQFNFSHIKNGEGRPLYTDGELGDGIHEPEIVIVMAAYVVYKKADRAVGTDPERPVKPGEYGGFKFDPPGIDMGVGAVYILGFCR